MSKFTKEHPNYCRHCMGWGGGSSPGSMVPYGSTFVPLPDEHEPCSQCVEEGLCPWCTQPLEEGAESCPCGWFEGAEGESESEIY